MIEYTNTFHNMFCLIMRPTKENSFINSFIHLFTEVYCDPLTKPQFGYYEPAGCTTTKQACRTTSSSTCIFYCNNGFERVGSTSDVRRVCQPNGQWSYSHARCKGELSHMHLVCSANNIRGREWSYSGPVHTYPEKRNIWTRRTGPQSIIIRI